MGTTATADVSEKHTAERKALEERQAAELSSAIDAEKQGETTELAALADKHQAELAALADKHQRELDALEASQAAGGQADDEGDDVGLTKAEADAAAARMEANATSSGTTATPADETTVPSGGTTSSGTAATPAADEPSTATQSSGGPPGYAPYQHVGMGLHGSPPPSSSASTSTAAEETTSSGTQSAANEPASSAATPADNAAVTVSSGGTVTAGPSTSSGTTATPADETTVSSGGTGSGETESETPASYGVAGLELLQQGASGFAVWHWDTAAASMSEALTSKDLDAAAASFRDGDIVHITASDGSAMRSVKLGHGALVWLRPVI